MIDFFDPYYTAAGCSEGGFPVCPAATLSPHGRTVRVSSDPILTHERWSREFKGCLVQLPTGTVSGVAALRINKPHDANTTNGVATFQRLQQRYGWNANTVFFEDSCQCVYLFECHNEVIIEGTAEIAHGVTLYGNGASIILPPYRCDGSKRQIDWGNGVSLTRETLSPMPRSKVDYTVHAMNVTESYYYHLRDAA